MSMLPHCLVFSKDRAMQLEAFLCSAERFADFASVTVLYAASDGRHDEAYGRLIQETRPRIGVAWFRDGHPGADFDRFVRWFLAGHDRVVFHTDDDVLFRPMLPAWPPAGVVGSYRLGRNITYCHPLQVEQQAPDVFPWKWREAELDFGYPLALNATIYQATDLEPLLDFRFENPTQLEAQLAARAGRFKPERMTAPLHSCCVSLPHNVVSVDSGCPRGGNPAWQPDPLCELFLDGWRIDLDAMDFSSVTAAHQEIPLEFTRV